MTAFLKNNWKGCAALGVALLFGYKLGFDKAYNAQVPPEYRDWSILRYLTGRELDINANGVFRTTIFGDKKFLYK